MGDQLLEIICFVCHKAAKVRQNSKYSAMGYIWASINPRGTLNAMITEEKIKAARKKLRRGEPEGEIRNELGKEGYSEEDIEKIFVPHKPDMRSWYLFFAIIFLLVGIYMVMAYTNIIFLLFSAGMFYVYYLEINKLKK